MNLAIWLGLAILVGLGIGFSLLWLIVYVDSDDEHD